MKQAFFIVRLFALVCILPAFITIFTIFEKLGLSEETAKKFVLSNVMGNFSTVQSSSSEPEEFMLPRAQMLASVITNDKIGAAKEMCAWVKDYTRSDEFLQAYTRRREGMKPTVNNAVRPDEETIAMSKESVAYAEKELAQMKKNKSTPAVTIATMEKNIKQQKEMIAEWDDPNPGLTRWNKFYPADPQLLIKKRLQSYLQIASTVDFDAKLTEADKYGIRKFINPEYEKKDNRWKAIYRAGREVNGVVAAFAKDWLKELSPSTATK